MVSAAQIEGKSLGHRKTSEITVKTPTCNRIQECVRNLQHAKNSAKYPLNAAFQISRRDKKAFLSDQCKQIEENNRMGKTRDLFKKIRDTKGTFHAKMGTIKDRKSIDLTEAEDIKKRWQEYTEELYKKDLHDLANHDGVITHLEPDILECEVKWA